MKPKPLFGDADSSPVWAMSFGEGAAGGDAPESVSFRAGCVIGVCQLAGRVEVRGEAGSLVSESSGNLLFALGHETAVELGGSVDTDVLVVGLDAKLIAKNLDPHRPGIPEVLRRLLYSGSAQEPVRLPMATLLRERLAPDLREPPVIGPAGLYWAEGKIQEFIALSFFHPEQPRDGYFCSRQNRLATERVAKTKAYLKEHLDQPVDLALLAEHVGCSAAYLSRTFSEYAASTISQYLRRLRIERAAELLISGRFTVSDVAVEVGYRSMSHFSKAFQQEKGCLPSRYEVA